MTRPWSMLPCTPQSTCNALGAVPKTVPCISLIGMAGAGKTTFGRALAARLGWAHLDTDRLMEAYWGCPLQDLVDGLGLEAFLQAEEHLVSGLRLWRTVISTGGSVIYGPKAIAALKSLGLVVYLRVSAATVCDRVEDGKGRGLVQRPGQSLAQLYEEREPLYRAAADYELDMEGRTLEQSLERLCAWLVERLPETAAPSKKIG